MLGTQTSVLCCPWPAGAWSTPTKPSVVWCPGARSAANRGRGGRPHSHPLIQASLMCLLLRDWASNYVTGTEMQGGRKSRLMPTHGQQLPGSPMGPSRATVSIGRQSWNSGTSPILALAHPSGTVDGIFCWSLGLRSSSTSALWGPKKPPAIQPLRRRIMLPASCCVSPILRSHQVT